MSSDTRFVSRRTSRADGPSRMRTQPQREWLEDRTVLTGIVDLGTLVGPEGVATDIDLP
jgi:hypothetical protein